MGKALWMNIPGAVKRYQSKAYSKAVQKAKRRSPAGAGQAFGVRKVSRRLQKLKRAYNARVKVWLVGKMCAVYPYRAATQVHHIRGRLGSLLMDERYWLPVSASGHEFIDSNRAIARDKGWLCQEGDWNRPGPKVEVKPENCLVTAASLLKGRDER